MSYDLTIIPNAFDAVAIREHFASRANYTFSGNQAYYSNDDTGVYFIFDIIENAEPEEDEELEGPTGPHIAFNLNYFRPHIFGLEAELELAALLQRFDSTIMDPQIDGMGEGGPYSREGFLKGWNAGNRAGFQAIGSQATPPPAWPADPATIEAIWRWNIGRPALQAEAGENLFVARISWFQPAPGKPPLATAIWTEGVPTILPRSLISRVALVRKPRLSIGRGLGLLTGKARHGLEIKLVGADEIANSPGVTAAASGDVATMVTPASGPQNGVFSGAWPVSSASVTAPENVCGDDLVALMKRA